MLGSESDLLTIGLVEFKAASRSVRWLESSVEEGAAMDRGRFEGISFAPPGRALSIVLWCCVGGEKEERKGGEEWSEIGGEW